MTEQYLQKKIITYLESLDAYVVKVMVASKSGVPDILCCLDGKFIGIEVKVGYNKTSKLQEYNIKRIIESGGISFVAYNLEDVKFNLSLT